MYYNDRENSVVTVPDPNPSAQDPFAVDSQGETRFVGDFEERLPESHTQLTSRQRHFQVSKPGSERHDGQVVKCRSGPN